MHGIPRCISVLACLVRVDSRASRASKACSCLLVLRDQVALHLGNEETIISILESNHFGGLRLGVGSMADSTLSESSQLCNMAELALVSMSRSFDRISVWLWLSTVTDEC